jgi:hypothetical protein
LHALLEKQPIAIRELAARIETEAKVTIEVVRSAPLHTDGNFAKAPAGCGIDDNLRCAILIFNDELTPESAAHELAHLERWLIDGVPRLFFKPEFIPNIQPTEYAGTSLWFENRLEHFHVFRRMKDLGVDPTKGLNVEMGKQWADITAKFAKTALLASVPTGSNTANLHENLTPIGYLGTHLDYCITRRFVDDPAVRSCATDFMENRGLLISARALDRRLNSTLHDKKETARMLIRELRLPRDTAYLKYFNGPAKTVKVVKVWQSV